MKIRSGTREHENLDGLLALLRPFNINIVYSDNNYAYRSHSTGNEAVTGEENTQKIERNHLSLRTWCSRLVRKDIRFSKELFGEQRISPIIQLSPLNSYSLPATYSHNCW
jgi:IS1 family transposase